MKNRSYKVYIPADRHRTIRRFSLHDYHVEMPITGDLEQELRQCRVRKGLNSC